MSSVDAQEHKVGRSAPRRPVLGVMDTGMHAGLTAVPRPTAPILALGLLSLFRLLSLLSGTGARRDAQTFAPGLAHLHMASLQRPGVGP